MKANIYWVVSKEEYTYTRNKNNKKYNGKLANNYKLTFQSCKITFILL